MANIPESAKPVFSLSEQAMCLRREIRMRRAVYPSRVAKGQPSFTQADMDREIGLMNAAATSLEGMAKNGLFRQLYDELSAARTLGESAVAPKMAQCLGRMMDVASDDTEDFTPKDVANALQLAGYALYMAERIDAVLPKYGAQTPVAQTPVTAPKVKLDEQPVDYATVQARELILKLLNHPAISRAEKTKQLLNLNRRTREQADEIIARLQGLIEAHDGPTTYKAAA